MRQQLPAPLATLSSNMTCADSRRSSVNPLFMVAIAADLLTPFLIWKGIVPAAIRWTSYAAIAVMILGVFLRMITFDHIPGIMWVVAPVSIVGGCVAFTHRQDVVSTLWGWWAMFQYPFVGLFAYLQPHWPESFPRHLRTFCVAVLAFELLVQIGQYLTGEIPGDNLAGTFGENGTGNLMLFTSLVFCLALGEWLAHQKWRLALLALALGGMSSVLGEVKLFLVVIALLGALSTIIRAVQGHFLKAIFQAVMAGIALIAFVKVYDAVVPGARSVPLESFAKNPAVLADYLGRTGKSAGNQGYYYDIGRAYALQYGWHSIQSDPLTFAIGLGLGARGESKTLGTAGTGLTQGHLGMATGTSLLVIMQETGLAGLIILGGFMLWIAIRLIRDIRRAPGSEAAALQYGLLLFTLLWPIWLWYNMAWISRVPMLIYWGTLGYVLGSAPEKRQTPSTSARFLREVRTPGPSPLKGVRETEDQAVARRKPYPQDARGC